MRRRFAAAVLFGLLGLGACERRQHHAPAPSRVEPAAFRHDLSGDISGEYRPVEPEGGVASLFIGQKAAFAAWEAGERSASPLILTLKGSQGEIRVLPQTYDVTDTSVRMTGSAPSGQMSLEARIDQDALATARRNLGDRSVVLSGTVQEGGRRTPIALTAWYGD